MRVNDAAVSVTVRHATPADVPAIVAVVNAAFLVEAFFIRGDRTTETDVTTLMAAGAFLVVDDDAREGTLAAAVHVDVRNHPAYFGMLAVAPSMQRHGLARALLHAVDAHCRAAGCTEIELTVFDARPELPPFYASCGYRPVGTRAFGAPELLITPSQLIVMRKSLDMPAAPLPR